MAAKLLIACFLLAMVSLATCKPRGMMNPFAKLFQRGLMNGYEKRAAAACSDTCSSYANCQGEIAGVGAYFQVEGSCPAGLVCCYFYEYE
mmetsp:Transcript_12391/g.20332  ORF Transcript_12391/g.20332 Transcript_12391/m.20332 type:complete len:90 (+) Transcript_12391:98-367(+)